MEKTDKVKEKIQHIVTALVAVERMLELDDTKIEGLHKRIEKLEEQRKDTNEALGKLTTRVQNNAIHHNALRSGIDPMGQHEPGCQCFPNEQWVPCK